MVDKKCNMTGTKLFPEKLYFWGSMVLEVSELLFPLNSILLYRLVIGTSPLDINLVPHSSRKAKSYLFPRLQHRSSPAV
jgi:hypothetical protein